MKKINKITNRLIKIKNLKEMLKNKGIKRIKRSSIIELEKYLEKNIMELTPLLKEQLIINSKKTLEEKDVLSVLKSLKKDKNYWEI